MAVLLDTETTFGLSVTDAYWRLNSFDQLANRQIDGTLSVPAIARFRAFASESAFQDGKAFLAEQLVTFTPSAIAANIAGEAYAALKALPEFAAATDA